MSKTEMITTFIYERIPRFILGALMFAAVAINIANVIARHIFHAPIIWAEEVLVFIMIWIIFTGAILVSHKCVHLKMDLVAKTFPAKIAGIIAMAADLATLAVCVVVLRASGHVLYSLWNYDQRSVVAEIPMLGAAHRGGYHN